MELTCTGSQRAELDRATRGRQCAGVVGPFKASWDAQAIAGHFNNGARFFRANVPPS